MLGGPIHALTSDWPEGMIIHQKSSVSTARAWYGIGYEESDLNEAVLAQSAARC